MLRGPLTEAGRRRLREAAQRNQPWRSSTGPRTAGGKAASAQNGHRHGPRPDSRRQLQLELAGVTALMSEMARLRQAIGMR
jgi:hypothetical protein